MKYLITGGAGFIGGHLTESMLSDGHQVVVIDNLSTGSITNLQAVANHPGLKFIEADILNYPDLELTISGVDAIIHLAAAVGVELVVRDPVHTIITNVHGTERVLDYAAKQHKRTIIASTSEVYGKSKEPEFSETDDLLIGCPTYSRWSYACSKLLDEFYLMAHHRASHLPGTVVRFFNTVGPRQTGQYGMVIPRFVAAALNGTPLQVYGDGNQSRCFCHVSDTVRALRDLINNDQSYGKIFNIGSRRNISIIELANLIIKQLGSKSEITLIPYSEAYEEGFEDMQRRKPNTNAIKKLINWEPVRSLEEIINDVAKSLQS
ncbi:MAG: GDP-mannose 4,6-dehydratase [Victivallaceae bacterium]|nr:GDP-mannose 4,6-dehydratase [Victivallaceae bacterium]